MPAIELVVGILPPCRPYPEAMFSLFARHHVSVSGVAVLDVQQGEAVRSIEVEA